MKPQHHTHSAKRCSALTLRALLVARDYNFATPLEVTGVVERLFEAVFMIGEDHMAVRSTAQPSATVGRLTAW